MKMCEAFAKNGHTVILMNFAMKRLPECGAWHQGYLWLLRGGSLLHGQIAASMGGRLAQTQTRFLGHQVARATAAAGHRICP